MTPERLTRRSFSSGLFASMLAGCRCQDAPTTTEPSGPPYLRRADVHLHISRGAFERALQVMDREGIAWGVNLSGGAPGGSLEEQLAQAKATNGRILTFTSPNWLECGQPGFGKRLANQLRQAARLGARGVKIHKALGLAVVDDRGNLLPVDAPALDEVFETAGDVGLPVWIHTADPLAFWDTPNTTNERFAELDAHPAWSLHGKLVPNFDTLYAQLERRVERHPKTTFVSVHFGNCAEQPQRVATSLRRYPNLWIDTAARIPELGRHPVATMQAFFNEFQGRILFGSDLGVGSGTKPLFLGSSGRVPPTDTEYRRFFDATRRYFESDDVNFEHPTPIQGAWTINGVNLRADVLEKLYVSNAERLLRG